jgi:hypothetical protein
MAKAIALNVQPRDRLAVSPARRDRDLVECLREELGLSVAWQPHGPVGSGTWAVVATPSTKIDLARQRLAEAMAPSSPGVLIDALMELSLMTAKRDIGAEASEAQIAAYVNRLRQYPADIALTVVRDWPDPSINGPAAKFWPQWAELQPRLDELSKARRSLLLALERLAPPPEQEITKSDEDRAEVRRLGDEVAARLRVGPTEPTPRNLVQERVSASEVADLRRREAAARDRFKEASPGPGWGGGEELEGARAGSAALLFLARPQVRQRG